MSEINTPEIPETPNMPDMPSSAPVSGDPSKDWMAYVSLGCGVLSLCAWLLPICGFPFAIAAIVFGVLGLKSSKRTLAIIGLAMGGLSFLLSTVNAILGAVTAISNPGMFEDMLDSIN